MHVFVTFALYSMKEWIQSILFLYFFCVCGFMVFFARTYNCMKAKNWVKLLSIVLEGRDAGVKRPKNEAFRFQWGTLVFLCFKFVQLLITITPPNTKIDHWKKNLERLVLQSVSCFKVIRVLDSWLDERSFSYCYLWMQCNIVLVNNNLYLILVFIMLVLYFLIIVCI